MEKEHFVFTFFFLWYIFEMIKLSERIWFLWWPSWEKSELYKLPTQQIISTEEILLAKWKRNISFLCHIFKLLKLSERIGFLKIFVVIFLKKIATRFEPSSSRIWADACIIELNLFRYIGDFLTIPTYKQFKTQLA